MNTWIILEGNNMLQTVHTEPEATAFVQQNNLAVVRRNHFIAGQRYEVSLWHVSKQVPPGEPLKFPEPVPVAPASPPGPIVQPTPVKSLVENVPLTADDFRPADRNAKVDAVLSALGELLRG